MQDTRFYSTNNIIIKISQVTQVKILEKDLRLWVKVHYLFFQFVIDVYFSLTVRHHKGSLYTDLYTT